MAAKDVKFSVDARDRMLRGVEILANALPAPILGQPMMRRAKGDQRKMLRNIAPAIRVPISSRIFERSTSGSSSYGGKGSAENAAL